MDYTITEFEKPGKQNTAETFKIAKEYAVSRGVKKIILASTTGSTALAAADFFKGTDIKLIVVGVDTYGWSQSGEKRKELENAGLTVLPCTHYLSMDAANALRSFSQGTKVAVEITLFAAEKGLAADLEEVVAVGGSGFGSDTALVLRPQVIKGVRKIDLTRILCMPQNPVGAPEGKDVFNP